MNDNSWLFMIIWVAATIGYALLDEDIVVRRLLLVLTISGIVLLAGEQVILKLGSQ